MLKRRHRKIQKYITTAKGKKPKSLKDHKVLAYSLSNNNQVQQEQQQQQVQQQQYQHPNPHQKQENPCWQDQDEQSKLVLDSKSKFKKLQLQQNFQPVQQTVYEEKLRKMYKNSQKMRNWANVEKSGMQGQSEKDINDYLNEELYEKAKSKSNISIQFHARSQQKHESIVTGLDWSKNVLFSSGLDQKLKIWSVRPEETNPELKMHLEKDIYMKDLPLSSCLVSGHQIYSGTLRKTIAVLDTEKWKTRFITSSYMNNHKTYENLRINKSASDSGSLKFSLHSENTITLFDNNFSYVNSFYTNEPIMDVLLRGNDVISITDTSFYLYDTRMMKIKKFFKTNLGYTRLSANSNSDILAIGSRLGSVYLYDDYSAQKFNPFAQVKNMLTHITGISGNSGNLILSLSKWKANAARLIDTSKGKCVGDWPTNKTKISFPTVGSFSQTGMFSVGSTNGYVTVFKMQ